MTDKDRYKLFCGGLTQKTDEHDMRNYFRQYGEVVFCRVNTDKWTEESRGFGFVAFANYEDMQKCLEESVHTINGKQVEVKRAEPRDKKPEPRESNKVFLGGIPSQTTKEDIMDALAGTGIIGAQVMTEKGTEKPRGFAFAFFDSVESARAVADIQFVEILDQKVECKMAQAKEDIRSRENYKDQGLKGRRVPQEEWPAYSDDRYGGYRGGSQSGYSRSYGYGSPYGHTGSYGYGYPGSYGYGSSGYPPSSYDMYSSSRGYVRGSAMGGSPMGGGYPQNESAYGPSRHPTNRSSNGHPYSRR